MRHWWHNYCTKGATKEWSLFMHSNKFFFLIAASLLTGAFCAYSAMADVNQQPYQQLTDVELRTAQTPLLAQGVQGLAGSERRYSERLPVQLDGAIRKVKAAKYKNASHRKAGKAKPVRAKKPAKTIRF